MAELAGSGFCDRRCEIDSYVDSVRELGIGAAVEGVLEPGSTRQQVADRVGAYHQELLAQSHEEAAIRPCKGYDEQGAQMLYFPPDEPMHCPIVQRILAGLIL